MRWIVLIKVIQYLFNDRRVLSAIAPGIALPSTSLWSNACDYLDGATTFTAGFKKSRRF